MIIGPEEEPHWDIIWRKQLLAIFEYYCTQLWTVGITEIYIDGSFVSDKLHPKDLDAYFVCKKEHWEKYAEPRLRELDSKFWNFESINKGTGIVKYPMWFDYSIEMYPVYEEFLEENVIDQDLKDPKPNWFRKIKYSDIDKGIIKIIVPKTSFD